MIGAMCHVACVSMYMFNVMRVNTVERVVPAVAVAHIKNIMYIKLIVSRELELTIKAKSCDIIPADVTPPQHRTTHVRNIHRHSG